jgi:hypothetical protein
MGLHVFTLLLLVISNPFVTEGSSFMTLGFWLVAVLVFTCFFNASLRNPGYLSCYNSETDQIFLSEIPAKHISHISRMTPLTEATPNVSMMSPT